MDTKARRPDKESLLSKLAVKLSFRHAKLLIIKTRDVDLQFEDPLSIIFQNLSSCCPKWHSCQLVFIIDCLSTMQAAVQFRTPMPIVLCECHQVAAALGRAYLSKPINLDIRTTAAVIGRPGWIETKRISIVAEGTSAATSL